MNKTNKDNIVLDFFHEWLLDNFYSKHTGFDTVKTSHLMVFSHLILKFYQRNPVIRHVSSFGNWYAIIITRNFKRAFFGNKFDDINNMFGIVFFETHKQDRTRHQAKGFDLNADMKNLLKKFEEDYEKGFLKARPRLGLRKSSTPIKSIYTRHEINANGQKIETTSRAKQTHSKANLPSLINVDTHLCRNLYVIANLILPIDGNYGRMSAWYYKQTNRLMEIRDTLKTDTDLYWFDGMTQDTIKGTTEDFVAMFERVHRIKVALLFIDVVASLYGGIPMKYQEVKNGRLYAIGDCNLQNIPRLVRKTVLEKCFDLDLENCHYALLYGFALKIGHDLNHIKDYLDNKKMYRETIANDLGLSVDVIKEALLSLIFGASVKETFYDTELKIRKETSLAYLLGDKLEAFHTHPLVKGLIHDLECGGKAVIEHHESNGFIYNLFGSRMSSKNSRTESKKLMSSSYRRKALSFLLQGAERFILDIMICSLDGSKIMLLQHDGLTFQDNLTQTDLKKIELAIREKTGLNMELGLEGLTLSHVSQSIAA